MDELNLNQPYDKYFAAHYEESPCCIEPTACLHRSDITTPVISSSTDQFANYGFPEPTYHIFHAAQSYATIYHHEHLSQSPVSIKCWPPPLAQTYKPRITPNSLKIPENGETPMSSNRTLVRKRKSTSIREPSGEDPNASTKPTRHHQAVKPKVELAAPTESDDCPPAVNINESYLNRNRIASNKFRARKRSNVAQLESEEYAIEDRNRQLRRVLESLKSEILNLKMQLLQHTGCDCELIQVYINKEAHQYVQGLEAMANTPVTCVVDG